MKILSLYLRSKLPKVKGGVKADTGNLSDTAGILYNYPWSETSDYIHSIYLDRNTIYYIIKYKNTIHRLNAIVIL